MYDPSRHCPNLIENIYVYIYIYIVYMYIYPCYILCRVLVVSRRAYTQTIAPNNLSSNVNSKREICAERKSLFYIREK